MSRAVIFLALVCLWGRRQFPNGRKVAPHHESLFHNRHRRQDADCPVRCVLDRRCIESNNSVSTSGRAEPIRESATPLIPVVSLLLDADDDLIPVTASVQASDLLVESFLVNSDISGSHPISFGLPGTTFHRAATDEYDWRQLRDDLLSGSPGDTMDDDFQVLIDLDDSLDLLAESAVAVPL